MCCIVTLRYYFYVTFALVHALHCVVYGTTFVMHIMTLTLYRYTAMHKLNLKLNIDMTLLCCVVCIDN